ncbi:MAG: hypothetical protein FJ403_16715 [Verrucomicrobia bacterium]|nr:hypothetical protein [Verrucomicrobiota bacterium]
MAVAWLWILFGFASGFALGLNFHREDWLGGYGSHRRRLYRLAHISFFGLAIINLLFYFTAREFSVTQWQVVAASRAFIVGAISMPICCLIMAHDSKYRTLFVIPVSSLMLGGILTFWEVIKL